jgi:hypothetical protein
MGNLSVANAASYFSDRASHGFNAVWINLLCETYTGCNADGKAYNNATSTADNLAPFTSGSSPSNYDFGTSAANANSAYFSQAHAEVAQAQADGIEVFLDPIPTDNCSTGNWITTLENNGDGTVSTTNKDYQYGQYLGNTFKDLANITWASGNDFQCSDTIADRNDALSVANGIANTDPSALQTLEVDECGNVCEGSSSFVNRNGVSTGSGWSSRLQINASYTYSPAYAQDLTSYGQSPTTPMILVESNYEGQNNSGTDGCVTVRNCRLQEWWTMTSGATGQLYGGPCYAITNSTTLSSCDTTGVTQLGYVTSLMNTVGEWYNLVPDTGNTLVTAGKGTCPTTGRDVSVNCVTAAETPDSLLGLAYLPDPSSFASITVALSAMHTGGQTTARWYDPTNGTFTSISGSPFTNTGTHTFAPTTNNSAGDKDWVLVLQST